MLNSKNNREKAVVEVYDEASRLFDKKEEDKKFLKRTCDHIGCTRGTNRMQKLVRKKSTIRDCQKWSETTYWERYVRNFRHLHQTTTNKILICFKTSDLIKKQISRAVPD